ncbi:MAG: cupredoxin domain-containing protein [Candidatus Brocadiia bacterium]
MRQRRATWVMAAISVVLLGALTAFGCGRAAEHHGEHMEGDEGGHMMEGGHHHDEPAEEHGEHMEESAGEHHEQMEETATTEEGGQPEPSGKVEDGVRVVQVAARQFEFDPDTIVVRQGEKVRLEVTSEDVTHGMGIEAYGIEERLPPGETQKIEFTADEPGTHHFHCTVYCGEGHGGMHGELMVLATSD